MKKLIYYADRYVKESNWKQITLLKFCLLSLGICMGLSIPAKKKTGIFRIAFMVFLVTLIPLLLPLIRIIRADQEAGKRHLS